MQNGFTSSFSGSDEMTFAFSQYLVGEHFYDLSDIKFLGVEFKLRKVIDWFKINGFKMDSLGVKDDSMLQYERPEKISVDLSEEKTLSFHWRLADVSFSLKHINSYEEELIISVNCVNEVGVEELLFDIVKFEIFFTVAYVRTGNQ